LWMYDTPTYEQGFCCGVNGFIEAVKNNAMSKNETKIPYHCQDCNNNLQLGDEYNKGALDHAWIFEGLYSMDPSW